MKNDTTTIITTIPPTTTNDNKQAEAIRKWIEDGLKLLVDNVNDLKVTMEKGENSAFYTVNAHIDDRGKIIGKSGKIANGFRALLAPIGKRHSLKQTLNIIE